MPPPVALADSSPAAVIVPERPVLPAVDFSRMSRAEPSVPATSRLAPVRARSAPAEVAVMLPPVCDSAPVAVMSTEAALSVPGMVSVPAVLTDSVPAAVSELARLLARAPPVMVRSRAEVTVLEAAIAAPARLTSVTVEVTVPPLSVSVPPVAVIATAPPEIAPLDCVTSPAASSVTVLLSPPWTGPFSVNAPPLAISLAGPAEASTDPVRTSALAPGALDATCTPSGAFTAPAMVVAAAEAMSIVVVAETSPIVVILLVALFSVTAPPLAAAVRVPAPRLPAPPMAVAAVSETSCPPAASDPPAARLIDAPLSVTAPAEETVPSTDSVPATGRLMPPDPAAKFTRRPKLFVVPLRSSVPAEPVTLLTVIVPLPPTVPPTMNLSAVPTALPLTVPPRVRSPAAPSVMAPLLCSVPPIVSVLPGPAVRSVMPAASSVPSTASEVAEARLKELDALKLSRAPIAFPASLRKTSCALVMPGAVSPSRATLMPLPLPPNKLLS